MEANWTGQSDMRQCAGIRDMRVTTESFSRNKIKSDFHFLSKKCFCVTF
jgi:hypothetical protein